MTLTIKDLAADIACAGIALETARHRVSHYAKNRFISGRRDGRNTSPTIYDARESAIAIMLSALQDCGVADHDILHSVSVASHFDADSCLEGLANGESWSLVVDIYRHPASGRFITANLVSNAQPVGSTMPVEMTPRGAIMVVLDEMLLPVVRRLHPPKGAH